MRRDVSRHHALPAEVAPFLIRASQLPQEKQILRSAQDDKRVGRVLVRRAYAAGSTSAAIEPTDRGSRQSGP